MLPTYSDRSLARWIQLLAGPLLSLSAFLVTYFVDPLNFGDMKPLAALPAFLLSVIILMISQNLRVGGELGRASQYSDRIYEAVKDYLHVTTVGSPRTAVAYIKSRLPAIIEARNTSFNISGETERAEEKLYNTDLYDSLKQSIAAHATTGHLDWKDIGDQIALPRFRCIERIAKLGGRGSRNRYRYKLINHNEPQLNFIILEYENGDKEVLFNWDYRRVGQDPTVLLSRDTQIVDMFSVQYALLWKTGSPDHDMTPTRSDEEK